MYHAGNRPYRLGLHRSAACQRASRLLYGAVGDSMSKQLPPVRVSEDKLEDAERRAKACGLNLSEYIRYRVYGKGVLTGEQLERVRAKEKLID